jgi:hypothetical protein
VTSSHSVTEAWNNFFFKKQTVKALALFRLLYSSLVIVTLLILKPEWLVWFGRKGLTTPATVKPVSFLNLFRILPQDDKWIEAIFWLAFVSAIGMLVGWCTRASSVLVFISLLSIQYRNPYIINGGDVLLRVIGFFLVFSPCGRAYSLDRIMDQFEGPDSLPPETYSPWAQRLIQFQISLLYICSVLWKLKGQSWINGSAVYYILHLQEYHRFPVPLASSSYISTFGCWSVIIIEACCGSLIWVRAFRYWIILTGVCLHLAIEYAMNIPIFEWVMICSYITFVDEEDVGRLLLRLRGLMIKQRQFCKLG